MYMYKRHHLYFQHKNTPPLYTVKPVQRPPCGATKHLPNVLLESLYHFLEQMAKPYKSTNLDNFGMESMTRDFALF